MRCIEYGTVVPVGAKIKCLGNSGYSHLLTEGKVYDCLYGLEAGIFQSRPFVTVMGESGREVSAHASRFELVQDAAP